MSHLQRHVVLTWLAVLGVPVLLGLAHDWPHIWWFTSLLGVFAAVVERPFLVRIYSVAPTPLEFFSTRPFWTSAFRWYGAFLAIAALSLLSFAQPVASHFGENPLLLFVLILSPMLFPLAAHQLAVYEAVADADA